MNGLKGRARRCAAVAVIGTMALGAGAGVAQAQRPASLGDGLPVGQTGTQMFNYNRFITGDAAQQAQRVEQVFAMLQSKGIRIAEPFSLHGMTATQFRALADKYGLHLVGRHGSVNEMTWDNEIATAKTLGQQFIGSGGTAAPGQGTYAETLATAATLNRLGKRSVEAGVGKVYIHNHTGEFDAKYDVNGTIKTAWEILMDSTDARYVAAEIDAGWASDAPVNVADLLNRYPTRIEMMHVKDLTGIAPIGRSGTPVQLGTGEIDYGPIFAAAKGKVKWFHYELDPPNSATFDALQTARNSFDAVRGAAAPALYATPPQFDAVESGKVGTPVPVTVENTGDAPLNITAVAVAASNPDTNNAADFTITSQTCTSGALAAGAPAAGTTPAVPAGTCTVWVAFKPVRGAFTQSIARLQFTSNADAATNRVQLLAKSGAATHQPVSVGGDVPTQLSLTLPSNPSLFGTFTPGTARDYAATLAAEITTTTGDATLTVADNSATAPGHLANGAFVLQQPLKIRANNATNTSTAYTTLPETTGTPLTLLTYTGPQTRDRVALGLLQSIGASETLRSGSYNKSLTFTLATTTP
jgi:sugar phosphate isomerase/epimerase